MYFIAEIGQAHEGSIGIAHSFIDALKGTGINAIKWQTHIALAESSEYEPFRIKFSYQDDTRFDYWSRMEFTEEQWVGLKNHCKECGFDFISSPFSNKAVELLERIDIDRFKIGSGEVNNFLMLEKIAKTGKPVILSSGMSSYTELDQSVRFFKEAGCNLSLLQCTTAYPTLPVQWGLNVISELNSRYGLPVGFSDHSGGIYACIAATALGAKLLEFHVTFDKRMFGPDSRASLCIDDVSKLTEGCKAVYESITTPLNKEENAHFNELKRIFEKSLAVNKDLKKGHILTFEDLEGKKPADKGIKSSRYKELIGRRVIRDLEAWSFIIEEHLERNG